MLKQCKSNEEKYRTLKFQFLYLYQCFYSFFLFLFLFFFFVATSSSFPRLFSLLRTNALKYFLVAHGRLAETRELKLFDLLTELSCQVNINLTAVFINF